MTRAKDVARSWLSREVLTLPLFAGTAGTLCGMLLLGLPGRCPRGLADLCSRDLRESLARACIYIVRARPAWFSGYTVAEFFSDGRAAGPLFVASIGVAGGRGCRSLRRRRHPHKCSTRQ